MKVLTYNVWFEDFDFDDRVEEILTILSSSKADFICL